MALPQRTRVPHSPWSVASVAIHLALVVVLRVSGAVVGLSSSLPTPSRDQPGSTVECFTHWALSRGVRLHPLVHLVGGATPSPTSSPLSDDTTPPTTTRRIRDGWGLERVGSSSKLSLQSDDIVLNVPQDLIWNAGSVYDELCLEFDDENYGDNNQDGDVDDTKNTTPSERSNNILKEIVQELQALPATRDSIAEFVLFLQVLKHSATPTPHMDKDADLRFWKPWLDAMPRDCSTAVSWTLPERECLPLPARAMAEYEGVKWQLFLRAYQRLAEATATASAATGQQSGNTKNTESHSGWLVPSSTKTNSDSSDQHDRLVQWAYQVVGSRCWRHPRQVAPQSASFSSETEDDDTNEFWRDTEMVPMGDMFNHRTPSNVVVVRSSVGGGVDFVYTGQQLGSDPVVDHNNDHDDDDTGLYLSYGATTNSHRFLTIFGFVDTSMKEVWSQLVFSDPDERLQTLGCNDKVQMVVRTMDGAVAAPVWDCILYSLLVASESAERRRAEESSMSKSITKTRPLESEKPRSLIFYDACMKSRQQSSLPRECTDTSENQMDAAECRQKFQAWFQPQVSFVLIQHFRGILSELDQLMDAKIDPLIRETETASSNLHLIRRHNEFLRLVFTRAVTGLSDNN